MNKYSFNGKIQDKPLFTSIDNRAFLYADALFDTLIYKANSLIFLEEHYFRLLASMRQLRMEIPSFFTQEYWEQEVLNTIEVNDLSEARVRTTVYRNALGLYTPEQNKVSILIQTTPLQQSKNEIAVLGLYKDNFLNTNHIDNIKTTNRIINTLAGIYSKENHFDNCL
jgi:branched-chain amino acid aminotransferase